MSELKSGVVEYDINILNKIVNNKDGYNIFDLVNISKYSFLRPMFDPQTYDGQILSEEEKSDAILSTKEKYQKYITKSRLQFHKKYGGLTIKYLYENESIFLPLSRVVDFIGNDVFLLDPYISQEYFAGVDKLIEVDNVQYENLFDNNDYREMHDDLETFEKNKIIGRRRVELLLRTERTFTRYMYGRTRLINNLNQKYKLINNLQIKDLTNTLLYRLKYNENILFDKTQSAAAAFRKRI